MELGDEREGHGDGQWRRGHEGWSESQGSVRPIRALPLLEPTWLWMIMMMLLLLLLLMMMLLLLQGDVSGPSGAPARSGCRGSYSRQRGKHQAAKPSTRPGGRLSPA